MREFSRELKENKEHVACKKLLQAPLNTLSFIKKIIKRK
jgi:hypothetical protein